MFAQFDDDLRFQWTARLRHGGKQNRNGSFAIGISDQVCVEGLAHRVDEFVSLSEHVSCKARHVLGGRLDYDLAFQAKRGGRRAVEIAPGRVDCAGFIRNKCGCRCFKFHVQPFRHEVFNQKCALGNCGLLRVCVQPQAPRPRHRRFGQGNHMRAPAETLIIQNNARVFNAVGARNNHSCWYGGRFALCVAHKCGDGHFLAAAIDAAFRVDVGVDGSCRIAALYAPVRKIERVHRQIKKRVFACTLFGN